MIDSIGPYLLGPNDTEENGIYTGDARELSKAIPPESIDLIFTDPVYDQIDDYEWLAETGSRILKMGGNLIAQTAHYYLNRIFPVMDSSGLDYVWTIAMYQHGKHAAIYKYKILACWKPFLWFSNGKRNGEWVMDWIKGGGRVKKNHKWEDNPKMFLNLIERLTKTDQIVFDSFTGSGTVPAVCKMIDRKYLAFEIDPDVAQMARDRVRNTQPPLPISVPEQGELL